MNANEALEWAKRNGAFNTASAAAAALAVEVMMLRAVIAKVEALPRVVVRYPGSWTESGLPSVGEKHIVVEARKLDEALHS